MESSHYDCLFLVENDEDIQRILTVIRFHNDMASMCDETAVDLGEDMHVVALIQVKENYYIGAQIAYGSSLTNKWLEMNNQKLSLKMAPLKVAQKRSIIWVPKLGAYLPSPWSQKKFHTK